MKDNVSTHIICQNTIIFFSTFFYKNLISCQIPIIASDGMNLAAMRCIKQTGPGVDTGRPSLLSFSAMTATDLLCEAKGNPLIWPLPELFFAVGMNSVSFIQ